MRVARPCWAWRRSPPAAWQQPSRVASRPRAPHRRGVCAPSVRSSTSASTSRGHRPQAAAGKAAASPATSAPTRTGAAASRGSRRQDSERTAGSRRALAAAARRAPAAAAPPDAAAAFEPCAHGAFFLRVWVGVLRREISASMHMNMGGPQMQFLHMYMGGPQTPWASLLPVGVLHFYMDCERSLLQYGHFTPHRIAPHGLLCVPHAHLS